MAKRQISGSRAIVTGASSGIGREIARELARQGASVVLVARRAERIAELVQKITVGGGRAEAVVGDVTNPMVQLKAVQTAQDKFRGLDILVNNAGVGAMGLFADGDPQRLRKLMDVNFFALVEMTRLALPFLKLGNRPIVVNISSILGHRGVPHNSEYSASKFAVQGFSEAIRAEFTKLGIDVLVVSPGTTETEFFDKVIQKTGRPNWPDHVPVSAAEVARRTVRAIQRGKHEIIPYKWGKVLCWLNRLSPRLTDALMARYV
jgi:short-subunit dehydrogenase